MKVKGAAKLEKESCACLRGCAILYLHSINEA